MTELFTTEGRTLYPATKAAMNFMGLPGGGIPRPPLRALTGAPLAGLQGAGWIACLRVPPRWREVDREGRRPWTSD